MEENEPLSSDEENGGKQITLEHVIEECGSFGRYQRIHFFFLALFPVASGIFNFYYVFGAAETPYECQLLDKHSANTSVEVLSSQCSYITRNELNEVLGTHPCTSWIYDRSIFGHTFTEEANLICQHSIYRSFLATTIQMGAMLTFFTGQIADLIGRRRSAQSLIVLLLVTSFITQGLLQCVPMSINQKFTLLLVNQFVAGIDTFMVSFILFIELTTSTHVTWVGNLALVAFAVGEVVVAVMAYVCRHWLLLKWAMTLYILALVPYLFFVPESPHWLLTKRRFDELEIVLRQMARSNRRSESKWFPFYRSMVENHRKQKAINRMNKIKLSVPARICRFITHVPTISRLFISGLLGFVTLFLYFKISFNLGAMDEIDPYLNIVIGAIVEAFGYIAASLFMLRYSRKLVMVLFLITTVICLSLAAFMSKHNRLVDILIAQFGKFAISGTVCVTYIIVPELFPTSIRATGMGVFVLFSRFGSTIAPTVDSMISHNRVLGTYVHYLYTVLTVICILVTLFLPETRNVPLADKIDYAMKKNSRNSSNIQSIART